MPQHSVLYTGQFFWSSEVIFWELVWQYFYRQDASAVTKPTVLSAEK